LVLLLGLLLPAPARADENGALLRALADEEAEGYEDALATWEAMDAEAQVTLLRHALEGEDDGLALIAARALGPEQLSWTEIGRQMSLLVRDPALLLSFRRPEWAPGEGFGLGRADVVPLFRRAAEDPELVVDPEAWADVHRAARPAHLPELVPLLEHAEGKLFDALLSTIQLVSAYDARDEHRALLARAFLYALERRESDAAGRVPGALAGVDVAMESDGDGLPPAFVRLVEARSIASVEANSVHWMRRWARDLVPAARDVALLEGLTGAYDSFFPFWALRNLARIGTPETLAFVEQTAAGEGEQAVLAAAALCEAKRPMAWRKVVADPARRDAVRRVAWAVDPARARALWLAGPDDSLTPQRRRELAVYEGIELWPAYVKILAHDYLASDPTPLEQARFFTEAAPEALTVGRAQRIAEELSTVSDDDLAGLDLDRLLGVLEVNAPDALMALLRERAETSPWAAAALLRLGAAPDDVDALVPQTRSDDEAVACEALCALAVYHGLDPRVARAAFAGGSVFGGESWAAVRRLVLEGDPVGAVLLLHEQDAHVDTYLLGLLHDPRAEQVLRRYRTERHHGLYWEATAGLALAGDAHARAEFLAFLEDGRTWMLDDLPEGVLTLAGDRDVARLWIAGLDTNCCLQFHALCALRGAYPTLPYENEFGLTLGAPVTTWWAEGLHRAPVWSRLLLGWVIPAPRE